jgi:hypothetical protein
MHAGNPEDDVAERGVYFDDRLPRSMRLRDLGVDVESEKSEFNGGLNITRALALPHGKPQIDKKLKRLSQDLRQNGQQHVMPRGERHDCENEARSLKTL